MCACAVLVNACVPGVRVCAKLAKASTAPGRLRASVRGAVGDLSCVCSPGNVRISDLGLAVELKEGQTKTKGYAGTPGEGSLGAQPLWGRSLSGGRGRAHPGVLWPGVGAW